MALQWPAAARCQSSPSVTDMQLHAKRQSDFDLQGCGGGCVPVSSKALAGFHVLELAKGVSIAVLGVSLGRLGRIALPCSVPVTCGMGG